MLYTKPDTFVICVGSLKCLLLVKCYKIVVMLFLLSKISQKYLAYDQNVEQHFKLQIPDILDLELFNKKKKEDMKLSTRDSGPCTHGRIHLVFLYWTETWTIDETHYGTGLAHANDMLEGATYLIGFSICQSMTSQCPLPIMCFMKPKTNQLVEHKKVFLTQVRNKCCHLV